MSLVLYHNPGSPASRCVLLTIRNLGLNVEVKTIDVLGGETQTEEYKKINPFGKVPWLIDGNFSLGESRAIAQYLVDSKAPGNSLYPTDLKSRALINSRLYYDATVIYQKAHEVMAAIFKRGEKSVPEEGKEEIIANLKFLDGLLGKSRYFAGETLTIADLSLLASISSIVHVGFDITEYKNLNTWYKNCATLPGYEENEAGCVILGNVFKGLLQK